MAVVSALRSLGAEGGDATGPGPIDRAKPGTRLQLNIDRQGPPLTCLLTVANRYDSRLVQSSSRCGASRTIRGQRRKRQARLYVDKACAIPRRRRILARGARMRIESSNRLGRHGWVVEQTFAWLNRERWLTFRYECRIDIHQPFTILACYLICFHTIQRLCYFTVVLNRGSRLVSDSGSVGRRLDGGDANTTSAVRPPTTAAGPGAGAGRAVGPQPRSSGRQPALPLEPRQTGWAVRTGRHPPFRRLLVLPLRSHRRQQGAGDQGQGDMPVPALPPPDFVFVESDLTLGFEEAKRNLPSAARRPNEVGQTGVTGGEGQILGEVLPVFPFPAGTSSQRAKPVCKGVPAYQRRLIRLP